MMAEDDPKLVYVPLEKAIVPPPGLIEHLKDRWWSVHPTRGVIFFRTSPQCNGNEKIAKRLQEQLYPWAECRFIPSVFRRIDPRDYV